MAGEWLGNEVLDACLGYIQTNGTRLDVLNAAATNYSTATTDATNSCGNKTSFVIDTIADGASGRKITSDAITDGTITETDTVTHWAITDGSSIFVCGGPLGASEGVTDTNTFTLGAFSITFPDPTQT